MGQQQDESYSASSHDKEILDILLESDLYLELPLKERQQLFKHIITAYLYSTPGESGIC
jgi:hypothetical protein